MAPSEAIQLLTPLRLDARPGNRAGRHLAGKRQCRWNDPDLEPHGEPTVLTGHTAAVNSVAISPDGTWLASASADQTVRVWNRTDEQIVLTGHTAAANSVAISPDGRWLAGAGADRTLRVWSPSQPDAVAAMRVSGRLHGCLWRPSSNDLFAVSEAGVYAFEFQPEAVR
jgi:WD40 repeat protein